MQSNEPIYPTPTLNPPSTNKHSIVSLILGILTVLALCGGMVPVPFTGFVCFPSSFLLGFFALIFGVVSLNAIRRQNESGSFMAWAGIIMGGLVFLCMLCAFIAIVSLFYYAPDSVQPIIEGYQL